MALARLRLMISWLLTSVAATEGRCFLFSCDGSFPQTGLVTCFRLEPEKAVFRLLIRRGLSKQAEFRLS